MPPAIIATDVRALTRVAQQPMSSFRNTVVRQRNSYSQLHEHPVRNPDEMCRTIKNAQAGSARVVFGNVGYSTTIETPHSF